MPGYLPFTSEGQRRKENQAGTRMRLGFRPVQREITSWQQFDTAMLVWMIAAAMVDPSLVPQLAVLTAQGHVVRQKARGQDGGDPPVRPWLLYISAQAKVRFAAAAGTGDIPAIGDLSADLLRSKGVPEAEELVAHVWGRVMNMRGSAGWDVPEDGLPARTRAPASVSELDEPYSTRENFLPLDFQAPAWAARSSGWEAAGRSSEWESTSRTSSAWDGSRGNTGAPSGSRPGTTLVCWEDQTPEGCRRRLDEKHNRVFAHGRCAACKSTDHRATSQSCPQRESWFLSQVKERRDPTRGGRQMGIWDVTIGQKEDWPGRWRDWDSKTVRAVTEKLLGEVGKVPLSH